jgi:predicted transcriptional regulator
MKRTSIYLDDAIDRDLRLLATHDGLSTASLVRDAVTQYVASRRRQAETVPGFTAFGRSGRSTVAERHESLLWQEPHAHGAESPRRRRRKTGA